MGFLCFGASEEKDLIVVHRVQSAAANNRSYSSGSRPGGGGEGPSKLRSGSLAPAKNNKRGASFIGQKKPQKAEFLGDCDTMQTPSFLLKSTQRTGSGSGGSKLNLLKILKSSSSSFSKANGKGASSPKPVGILKSSLKSSKTEGAAGLKPSKTEGAAGGGGTADSDASERAPRAVSNALRWHANVMFGEDNSDSGYAQPSARVPDDCEDMQHDAHHDDGELWASPVSHLVHDGSGEAEHQLAHAGGVVQPAGPLTNANSAFQAAANQGAGGVILPTIHEEKSIPGFSAPTTHGAAPSRLGASQPVASPRPLSGSLRRISNNSNHSGGGSVSGQQGNSEPIPLLMASPFGDLSGGRPSSWTHLSPRTPSTSNTAELVKCGVHSVLQYAAQAAAQAQSSRAGSGASSYHTLVHEDEQEEVYGSATDRFISLDLDSLHQQQTSGVSGRLSGLSSPCINGNGGGGSYRGAPPSLKSPFASNKVSPRSSWTGGAAGPGHCTVAVPTPPGVGPTPIKWSASSSFNAGQPRSIGPFASTGSLPLPGRGGGSFSSGNQVQMLVQHPSPLGGGGGAASGGGSAGGVSSSQMRLASPLTSRLSKELPPSHQQVVAQNARGTAFAQAQAHAGTLVSAGSGASGAVMFSGEVRPSGSAASSFSSARPTSFEALHARLQAVKHNLDSIVTSQQVR